MPGFANSTLHALLRRLRALRDRQRCLRTVTAADVAAAVAASDAARYSTVAGAQAALAVAAFEVKRAADLLDEIHAALPEPPDIEDRQEGRKPYDCATDILATIECVLEDNLRPAVETLWRSARVTDADLEHEYREWLKREGRS
jgi:hypothetical protein